MGRASAISARVLVRGGELSVGPVADRARAVLAESRGLLSELGRLPRERRLARPRPPAAGLVIDLGGGHAPVPRSDAVVDKYVADDFERGSALSREKPLIVADGQRLPFESGAIAYLVTAHVLEHATDPRAFAEELGRVAQAGFVQVPSRLAEQTFGWPFHPWQIDRDGDVLVFEPKRVVERDPGPTMHDVHEESPLFRLFFFTHRSDFHHTVHWTGRLDVRVRGSSAAEETAELDVEQTVAALKADPAPPLSPQLRAILRCPSCRGTLHERPAVLECSACGRDYPVVASVPLLLEEAVGRAGAMSG